MNPYYMTPETRHALIAESNRLIAARGARRAQAAAGGQGVDSVWPDSQGDAETAPAALDSTFARLVADLQSTSVSTGRDD